MRIQGMMGKSEGPFDVEPHLGVLRRYALVLTRDAGDAEDLVQEALVRAIASASTWQPERGLRPWLLAIVHNVHVSRRRRQQAEAMAAGALSQEESRVVPPAQLSRVELAQTVSALMSLPEGQREVLTLVAIDGLSYKDAAEILELPLGTLMSRLARARESLRRAVGDRTPARAERPPLRMVSSDA